MGSIKGTLKKKIGALSVVAACSQFIKHKKKHKQNFKHKKMECWVKPWLAEKHKSLHHGLVSELLLYNRRIENIFENKHRDI